MSFSLRVFFLLLPVCWTAWAEPVISEFMASNQNGLTDENGDRPDWIEIRNPDATAVSLAGWALTDLAANPTKWVFPAVTVPANGYVLVFASGKDRRAAGQTLHSNFSLSAGGEYLALVRPDGSRSTEWTPGYPPQYPDISYGTSSNTTDVTFVQQSTSVRALAPTDTSLIPQWRTIGFNDAAWRSGTFAVGYMNANANPFLGADLGVDFGAGTAPLMNDGTARHSYSRARFTVVDTAAIQALMLRINYDDGFVAWLNGTRVANSAGAPTADPISPTATVGGHGPGVIEDFPLPAAALAALVVGTNVLAIEGFNTSAGSSDAFVLPQLLGTQSTGGTGVTGYFTAATPGALNGGVNTIQLPIQVSFSRPSGTFGNSFQLALGGAGAGQEIRYILADPSGSPGAALGEPTVASTLYTGPIGISSSKLIRATIFQGTQKSRTATAQYLQLEAGVAGNTTNFTSSLPILVLDDHGAGQPNDSSSNVYTTTLLHLFEPVAGTTRLGDPTGFDGVPATFARAGTRVRGSSSAGFAKKSYGLETWDDLNTDFDLPLLGMGADSDWVLNGPWLFDDTYIHNAYIYEISRRIGRWAPRTQPCEVFFNQNGGKLDYGDYAGVYMLTEKIKSGKSRLDIATLGPGDLTPPAVTGGYIFKIDRADGGEFSWTIDNTSFGLGTLPSQDALVMVEPDPDFDTVEQQTYLRDTAVKPFNDTLFAERAAGFATRNYRNAIDVPSFVDHHILNSLAYNVDALRLSAFYFKDRNRKISAGPIWDFDRALGSDDGRDATPASWGNIGYFFDRDWWGGLFKDPQFVQEWVDRWWQLRQPGQPFATSALTALADQMGAQIGNAAGARDAARWSPDNNASGGVYLNEISAMKSWLSSRLTFIDAAAPAPPTATVASGPVVAGSTVTLAGGGAIRYTTDGSDPRPFGGATPGGGSLYAAPLAISATTVLTARRSGTFTPFPNGASSISWSAPLTRVYLVNEAFAVAGDVAVSEINYHPVNPTAAELAAAPGASSEDFEWIELKNRGARTVNTFELTFPAGYPFERELRLTAKSLAPGQTALVVKNRAAFQARNGSAANSRIVGEWQDGNLNDGGEEIRLLARDTTAIQTFAYSDGAGWPDRADGAGATLEYIGAAFADPDLALPGNWRASSEVHGSPGAAGAGPDGRILINEVLSHSNLPRVDAIELHNTSGSPVDVGGWFISDVGSVETVADYKKFRVPTSTTIPAGGYVVFTETQFNPNGLWNPGAGTPGPTEFAFDAHHGDDAWLLSADAAGTVLKFIDHVDFGPARPDETWGRYPNGSGSLQPMLARTLLNEASGTTPRPGLGAANSSVRIGPLILQEIHHTPAGGNTDLEFVEIFNPTNAVVPLAHWRLRGAVDYDFLLAESVPAGGVLVVVPFAPTDVPKAASFRAAYATAAGALLAGPWKTGGHLGSSDRVALFRAEPPPAGEPSYFPMVVEDESQYVGTGGGWPTTTAGASLNRTLRAFGDVAASWFADVPSPGDPHLRFSYWKSIQFPAGGPGTGDHDDFDHDGLDNALEFALATNPLAPAQLAGVLPVVTSQPGAAGSTNFLFTYTRPLNRPGVVYTVQKSGTLAGWTAVSDVQLSSTTTTETRRATVNSIGATRLFLRLIVAVAP